MNLFDVLDRQTLLVKQKAGNKSEVLTIIAELASKVTSSTGISSKTILKALTEREELASTGLGAGVAVPHCRIPGLNNFVVGMITTSHPLDFQAADKENVDIFPFVIGPEENPKEHLKVLSGMARLLRNPDTRKAIRNSETADQLYEFIRSIIEEAPVSVPVPSIGMRLMHVFVRNESLFNDILQVFASEEITGAMVMEAHESTEYMSSMPVFAGFWNSELNSFNRIIVAVIKESLLYQTLRSIEYVCGDLRTQSDVMIAVADLHNVTGSLEF
jgi:PTS system nitrogen regulatory IIA component